MTEHEFAVRQSNPISITTLTRLAYAYASSLKPTATLHPASQGLLTDSPHDFESLLTLICEPPGVDKKVRDNLGRKFLR